MPCIAQYDKKIQIEQLVTVAEGGTADAHGHIDNTADENWFAYESAFASVQSKGGREFWKVDQVNADVSHVWKCQYTKALAAVTPDMRLVSESVTYEIQSVVDIDLAHREIEIQTKRAV